MPAATMCSSPSSAPREQRWSIAATWAARRATPDSASLGTPGTLQNSQCSIDTGASSASGSGNNLTLNLAVTFKAAFSGSKNDYMQVQDNSSTLAPWQARGAWTVATVPPTSVSVTP